MVRPQDDYRVSSAGPTRSSRRDVGLSTSSSASTLPLSPPPRATRAQASKPTSFSPYARRTRASDRDEVERPIEVPGGLFGAMRRLPGKAFGYLWRSASTQSLSSSRSVSDLEEEAAMESTGASRGRGMSPAYVAPVGQGRELGRSMTSSNLASLGGAPTRSLHSTLTLPPSRAGSPALSAASLRRSPSPTRNQLGRSMSAFNLNEASPAAVFTHSYGLTSRSPFVSRTRTVLPRSSSGQSLFPYTAASPRGSRDDSSKRSIGQLSDEPSRGGWGRSTTGGFVPALHSVRQSSPLTSSFNLDPGRARNRQLVWDPEKGFISKEEVERERTREETQLPTNEAERILEALEAIGRTEPKRAQRVRRSKCPVRCLPLQTPIPSASSFTTRLQIGTPISPYARNLKAEGTPARTGTGLSSVFRAREERRRAAEDADREEREEQERERAEDEARELERERRRNERRRQREIEREEEEERDAMVEDVPRRKTRSMVKSETSRTLSTMAKTPKKGKGKGRSERGDDDRSQVDDAPKRTRSKRAKESPPPRTKSSPPPTPDAAPPVPVVPPPYVVAPLAVPAPSMRPARSHSSRTHVTSSRVFSAREEDLPPVDDGDLGKIKLPPMVFPTGGLSFVVTPKPMEITPAPLEAPQKSLLALPAPPVPALVPTPAPTPKPFAVAPSKTTATAPDFFSRPVTPAPAAVKVETTTKPSFFGAALAAPSPPVVVPPPAFSFGAPAPAPVASVANADLPNPFSAFGAPTAPAPVLTTNGLFGKPAEVRRASLTFIADELQKAPPAPFAFGAPPSAPLVPAPAPFAFGAPVEAPKAAKPSPFAFNAPSSASSAAPAPLFAPAAKPETPAFSFGAAPAIEEPDEDSGMEDHSAPNTATEPPPASATSFTFGAPAAAAAAPAFSGSFAGFGEKPAAKPAFGAAAGASLFAPSGTASPFGFGSASPSPAHSPAPGGSFTFGATTPAASSGPAPFTFGAAPSFGSNPASSTNSPSVAPFTFGAAPSAPATNMFGSAPAMAQTTSAPSFGAPAPSPFGAAPSPFGAPAAGGSGFFGQPAATPSFSFGTPAAAPPMFGGAPAPAFGFGSPAPSAPAPFAFGAMSSTPGAAAPSFFGAPASAPGSPAPGGAMFNLGSGGDEASKTPGGRRIAPLRRKPK